MAEAKCNIIVDSCCDLPRELIDGDGVELLQFPYLMDDEQYSDDMFTSVTAREFYEKMRKGSSCSTAQIPVPVLTEAFERALASGVPTVYLGFSSGLSGTFDAARLIADELRGRYPEGELYTVDTHLASIAEGVLVYEALLQREKGLSARELAAWAEEARFFVNEHFTLDSLQWLQKGGRIPASVAFAGSKLDVKPILDISLDGKLALSGAARGRKKSIRQLVEYYEKHCGERGCGNRVIIGHADSPKDLERLREGLLKVDSSLLILEASIGPVIGSHVGPGMLAVAFMGKDERESLSVTDRIANKVRQKG